MNKFTLKSPVPIKKASLSSNPNKNPEKNVMNSDILDHLLELNERKLREQYEALLKQEADKAYHRGFKDGKDQSQIVLNQQLQPIQSFARRITEQFRNELNVFYEKEEQQILELILHIARKVIHTEVTLNPEIVLNILRSSLRLLSDRRNIVINVNSADWSLVKESMEALGHEFDIPADTEIRGSQHLEKGSVRIDTDSGTIDSQISTQIDEITRKILKEYKI